MVAHVFDNGSLSQVFAMDTWRAVIYSLGRGPKHMLVILSTSWRTGFSQNRIEIIGQVEEKWPYPIEFHGKD